MISFSIIQKSQLEKVNRIDSQYFEPEYLEYEKKLQNTHTFKRWGDFRGKFITGPFGSEFNTANYVSSGMYRYIRGKDVRPFVILENDNVYISQSDFEKLNKYSLEDGDILISVVGTLGYTAIVDKKTLPAVFSCKSTVFRSKEVDPSYLIAYLNSKYGYNLLIRNERGANQTGLNIDDLKTLPICIPSLTQQKIIGQLIKNSKQVLADSISYYSQAENLLLEELGLKNFKPREDLSFVANLSEVAGSNRVDSDFFQPKYEEILRKLKNHQTETLTKNFEILKGKNFAYSENGEVGVIKTKQLGKQFINFDVEDKTKNEIVKKESLPVIESSDVIFASMGVGSLGKTNIFYNFENEVGKFTIDSTLRIFRPTKANNVLPEVLVVYLSSWAGQELIYKFVVGSSGIISIYENYLKEFSLPVLPAEIQKEIAELVIKSHEARKKSKELLEEAKRKVEEMIEKGNKN